jgi:hypothetical protein
MPPITWQAFAKGTASVPAQVPVPAPAPAPAQQELPVETKTKTKTVCPDELDATDNCGRVITCTCSTEDTKKKIDIEVAYWTPFGMNCRSPFLCTTSYFTGSVDKKKESRTAEFQFGQLSSDSGANKHACM